MSSHATPWPPPARLGEPVWEISEFFPEQGSWTEGQYLALDTNRLVEFDNGSIEVLAVPTKIHQMIVVYIFKLLDAIAGGHGRVFFAPYRVRILTGKYREPDIIYMTPEQDARAGNDYTDSAEIVMEVVSPHDRDRDYVKKRADYAAAGIPEYWILDRDQTQILVLQLRDDQYIEYGR